MLFELLNRYNISELNFNLFTISVAALTKAIGRMANDTVWEWSPGVDGCTGANGHKASKADTGSDSPQCPWPDTRARGQMDFRMDMGQRHMPMEVGYIMKCTCIYCSINMALRSHTYVYWILMEI